MVLPLRLLLAVSLAVSPALSHAQDIPQGVHYKKAPAEVNARAKAALTQALSGDSAPARFFDSSVMCGPMLWHDLKSSHEALSKDSTPVNMTLPGQQTIQAEGRGLRTPESKTFFWKLVLEKYPALRKGIVRPAKPSEIQYYWYTIPFDIEEPLFAIETPDDVFIVNLTMEGGAPALFWLDRVDDLQKLKQ